MAIITGDHIWFCKIINNCLWYKCPGNIFTAKTVWFPSGFKVANGYFYWVFTDDNRYLFVSSLLSWRNAVAEQTIVLLSDVSLVKLYRKDSKNLSQAGWITQAIWGEIIFSYESGSLCVLAVWRHCWRPMLFFFFMFHLYFWTATEERVQSKLNYISNLYITYKY